MNMSMNLLGAAAVADWFDDTAEKWGSDVAWLVGTNMEYAPHQEWGTSSQRGTPHLRPAADRANAQMAALALRADDIEDLVRLTALYMEGEVKRLAPVDTGALRSDYAAIRIR